MSSSRTIRNNSGTSRKTLSQCMSHDINEIDRFRQESVVMKAKIRSLELEVDTLKQRLDGLRKAKNTTLVKREREEIMIQPLTIGKHRSQRSNSRETRLSQISTTSIDSYSTHGKEVQELLTEKQKILLKEKDEEIQQLKSDISISEQSFQEKLLKMDSNHVQKVKELEEKLENNKQLINKREEQCVQLHLESKFNDMRIELERLRRENVMLEDQLSEVVDVNVKLRESNLMLQGKCETLLEDLSIKEAKWSEKEDMLHAEIRKQWGDRYHQWITRAEKKMEELQQINVMLYTNIQLQQKAEKKMEELQQINVMLQKMMKTKAQNPSL